MWLPSLSPWGVVLDRGRALPRAQAPVAHCVAGMAVLRHGPRASWRGMNEGCAGLRVRNPSTGPELAAGLSPSHAVPRRKRTVGAEGRSRPGSKPRAPGLRPSDELPSGSGRGSGASDAPGLRLASGPTGAAPLIGVPGRPASSRAAPIRRPSRLAFRQIRRIARPCNASAILSPGFHIRSKSISDPDDATGPEKYRYETRACLRIFRAAAQAGTCQALGCGRFFAQFRGELRQVPVRDGFGFDLFRTVGAPAETATSRRVARARRIGRDERTATGRIP